MAHSWQIVDSIATTPVVLLDLDNRTPFTVVNGSVSPPKLRRSSVARAGDDGTLDTGSSYENRTLKLKLNVWNNSSDSQSSSIQTLARLLDRQEGVWIKWQSEGKTVPMFFRTKRADLEVIDLVQSATPERDIVLDIPCEPFAYGLEETGNSTITNDPTSGTNKMMMPITGVKGDVASPLHVSFPTADAAHRLHVASQAAFDGTALSAPYYKSLSAATKNPSAPPGGGSITDIAAATYVAGTRREISQLTGSSLYRPTSATVLSWDNLPPGDYRVFVRVGHNGAVNRGEVLFFNRPPVDGSATFTREEAAGSAVLPTFTGGGALEWLDLGVVAMPGDAPITDVSFDLPGATGTALWNVCTYAGATGTTFNLDAVVLVPAGRPDTVTRHGAATFDAKYTAKTVTFDGVNGRKFAVGTSVQAAGTTSPVAPEEVSGGYPLVVPGAANVLHFFAHVASSHNPRLVDTKATTTVVTWKYYPRYLYDRPATT